MHEHALEHAGFWIRVGATAVDCIRIGIVTIPTLIAIHGWAYFSPFRTGLIAGPGRHLKSV